MAAGLPASASWRERREARALLLALGAAALIAGLWSGLSRIGLALPGGSPFADIHGALLICGFFGTLIALERAVAIDKPWAYLAPALSACGAIALLLRELSIAGGFFLAASTMLTVITISVVKRQPLFITAMMTVAAACWGIGTWTWLAGHAMAEVTGWWLAFLVLTIGAERLELSRVLAPSPLAQAAFAGCVALILAGAARGDLANETVPLLATGFLACALWLFVHDVAPRVVRRGGQMRFCAVAMLGGYFWLGVAGALLLASPQQEIAFGYDAAVHAITIGFVLSMVFGHALIVLPAVMKLRLCYSGALYAPLALLHASLALRVVSDILEWSEPRAASGMLTIAALALFAATLATASARKSVASQ
jgi:hypothetical protein